MAKNTYPTPMLDELENGPWPSFITGIKALRDNHPDERINSVTNGLLDSWNIPMKPARATGKAAPSVSMVMAAASSRVSPKSATPSRNQKSSTPSVFSRQPATSTPRTCCASLATAGRSMAQAW